MATKKRLGPHENRIKRAQADRAEFNLKMDLGKFIDADLGAAAWESRCEDMRARLMGLPNAIRRLPTCEAMSPAWVNEHVEEVTQIVRHWIEEFNRGPRFDD